jgi:hypothetical protein
MRRPRVTEKRTGERGGGGFAMKRWNGGWMVFWRAITLRIINSDSSSLTSVRVPVCTRTLHTRGVCAPWPGREDRVTRAFR